MQRGICRKAVRVTFVASADLPAPDALVLPDPLAPSGLERETGAAGDHTSRGSARGQFV